MNYQNKTKEELIQILDDLESKYSLHFCENKILGCDQHYQRIIRMSNEGIAIVQNLKFVYVNPKISEISGYTEDELKSKPFENFIYPEDKEMVLTNSQKRLNGEPVGDKYEVRTINKLGQIHWVELRGLKIVWQDNPAVLVFLNDITESKAAVKALRDSEAQFRFLTEHSSDVIWHLDKNYCCDYISLADEKMRGYTQEEVIGTPLFDILKPEAVEMLKVKIGERVAKEKMGIKVDVPHYELEEKCKDGSWVWVEATANPEYDENGNSIGLHGVTRNITERKKNEAEIKLKTEQLIEASLEKDRFLSMLAHDLRSPFNSILGYLNLLSEDIDKLTVDEIKRFVQRINTSANNTYSFLEDLLLWAQPSKIPFNPIDISFQIIWKDVLKTIDGNASQKNITIKNIVNEDLTIFADSNMLKAIIRNLTSNAIKFTQEGGTITINSKKSNKGVEFSIADNGVGMAESIKNSLFNKSESSSSKGTLNESGTGFGLILCKEFIEKHNGEIWVDSELGKGSTFKFNLNLKS